ncbi:hypothetical protein JCM10449v2_000526 [Rhodotorula kratochvilovae]
MAPVVGTAGPSTPLTMLSDPDKHLTAWVTVDDKPVPVYKVEHGERKTTCYIEAVEGKEYQVRVKRSWRETDLCCIFHVDGVRARSYSFKATNALTSERRCVGVRVSDTQVKPFVFAPMMLTDDGDAATTSEHIIKSLGTVQVHALRAEYVGMRDVEKSTWADPQQHVVDERGKKATMSHATAYGEAKRDNYDSLKSKFRHIDGTDSPSYTLEFKYRSRALLELDDIVAPAASPASPTPPPVASTSATARGSGESSPATKRKKRKSSAAALEGENEDLRAKIARLEAENSQLKDAGVKREGGGEGDVKPLVKGEPIGKVSTENGRTVIDLLDEDDD